MQTSAHTTVAPPQLDRKGIAERNAFTQKNGDVLKCGACGVTVFSAHQLASYNGREDTSNINHLSLNGRVMLDARRDRADLLDYLNHIQPDTSHIKLVKTIDGKEVLNTDGLTQLLQAMNLQAERECVELELALNAIDPPHKRKLRLIGELRQVHLIRKKNPNYGVASQRTRGFGTTSWQGDFRKKQREYGLYETSPSLADRVVLEMHKMRPFTHACTVLEPSAGRGNLLLALERLYARVDDRKLAGITAVDILDENVKTLMALKLPARQVVIRRADFLTWEPPSNTTGQPTRYDRILQNAPFGRQRELQHVLRAYKMLAPGGLLATILPQSFALKTTSRALRINRLIRRNKGKVIELPDGAFVTAGAGIKTVLVLLPKGGK